MQIWRGQPLHEINISNTENLDLECLFGSDFLVAPILTTTKQRRVYLPEGDWFDFSSKEKVHGGGWIQAQYYL